MRTTATLLTLVAAAALVPRAHAVVLSGTDHLKCYAAKDGIVKTTYTADLASLSTDLPTEMGCRITVPAKLVCDAVEATLDPPPAPPHPGQPLAELLVCYKLKCPRQRVTLTATDEFGSRPVTVSAPKLVCAPANVGAD